MPSTQGHAIFESSVIDAVRQSIANGRRARGLHQPSTEAAAARGSADD